MNLSSCFCCIYYNLLSNFYITISTFLPGFENEIINLQYKAIECINEDYIFAYNSRKRKRFNIFVDNLVKKNNEFLEKMKLQEQEDNDLQNYDKINDSNCDESETNEESSETESSECSEESVESDKCECEGDGECSIRDEEEETIYETDKKQD